MSMIDFSSARVISFAELKRVMSEDPDDYNIYVMNIQMAENYCKEYDIELNPILYMKPHVTIHVFGHRIEILAVMPDNEVLVIDKSHPNW